MLVCYDPETRYFLWRFWPEYRQPALPHKLSLVADLASRNRAAAFAAHDGIFLFESWASAIRVTESTGTAFNLEDAQSRALKLLKKHLTRIRGAYLTWIEDRRLINLSLAMRLSYASIFDFTLHSVERQKDLTWTFLVRMNDQPVQLNVKRQIPFFSRPFESHQRHRTRSDYQTRTLKDFPG